MFELLGAAYLGIFSIPLAIIDIRERRLPNKLTLPAIAITLTGLLGAADWNRMAVAVLCGVSLFTVGTLLSFKGWLGMGDAKLLVSIGLTLGWYGAELLAMGLALAFGLAGLVVLIRVATNRITKSSTIALGPYLLLGFWLALFIHFSR
jgi:leader peptidase (prepilin peptidase)/N-methyltransferase